VETDQTQLLSTFLRERDVPCPRCAYNLRNATQPRCSECGLPIELAVQSVVSVNGHWTAAMVLFGANALLGLFFLCLVLQREWPDHRWHGAGNLTLLGYMLQIPVPPLLYLRRKRFVRLPVPTQMSFWIVGALLAGVLLLGLMIWVR
jgi:hypothetical protein